MKRLIVGVDPGLNCGLAILTLGGFPLLIESRRSWAFTEIITRITELGEPTIISSDVARAPEVLERLSQKLNAVLFTPPISMGTDEKHQLAKAYIERYELRVSNIHETDALAAAVKAYHHYRNKFEQVESKISKINMKISIDEAKDLIVRGHTLNRAVQILLRSGEIRIPTMTRREMPREEKMKNLVRELNERMLLEKEKGKRLRAANRDMRVKIRSLDIEISELKKKIEEIRREESAQIRREREYHLLQDEVQSLKNRILESSVQLEAYKQRVDQLQRLRELESQGRTVLLKPVEAFTKEGLEKAFRLYGVKAGDFVFLLDPSGGGAATAESLGKRGIKAVISQGAMSHQAKEVFGDYLIPVIFSERLRIEWIEGLPYADSENLREAEKHAKIANASKAFEELRTIVEDHRKELRGQ